MMCFTTTFFLLFSILSLLVTAKGPAPGGPTAPNNEETSCLPSLPLFKKHSGTRTVGNGIQAIFSSAVIECNGVISSWSAYTKGNQERRIHFQIWRPTTYRMYTLVGENVLTNARPVNEVVTLNVDTEEFINVQNGDIVGIYQETSTDTSVKVKTKPDREGKMWQYMTSVSPSIGLLLELSVGNGLLQSKEEVPIISIVIHHDSVNAAPTVPVSQSTQSSLTIQPTNNPSTPTNSADNNADNNQDFTNQSNNPRVNDNDEEDDCDSEKDNSMFLTLVVLVMTIAILLLVVFILGTALVLVSLKLRHAKDGSSSGTPNNSCNRDTYVGKQVVLIEEGHGRSGFTHSSIIGKPTIDNSIENPSYTVDKNERNKQMDNRITYDNQSNCTSSCSNQTNAMPVIAEVIRERTDSSSTTSTRGFNAQEYESPQMYSATQNTIPHVIPPSIMHQPHYSRPRIAVPVLQRQTRVIPVESNVSYTQANKRKQNLRTVEHV